MRIREQNFHPIRLFAGISEISFDGDCVGIFLGNFKERLINQKFEVEVCVYIIGYLFFDFLIRIIEGTEG